MHNILLMAVRLGSEAAVCGGAGWGGGGLRKARVTRREKYHKTRREKP